MTRILLSALLCGAAVQAATIAADSTRGEALFESLSCVQCHSVNGRGGTLGPDLGKLVDRSFTPAALAATMWNHAPTMWAAMRNRRITPGDLNQQAAMDLLAFFYSARFFEKPGDAGRGKTLFIIKHCAECHGVTTPKLPEAKPIVEWQSTGHPIELINAMWNHVTNMKEEFARRKIAWPELTTDDLSDILVYVRNIPGRPPVNQRMAITAGNKGEELFQAKGCSGCHKGKLDLPPLIKGQTLTDIAVDMWNHAPRMAKIPPKLDLEEMREIISYIWAEQFFRGGGNPAAGERVFSSKHCASCHNDPSSGAPKLGGQSFDSATMISALWHHGPNMLALMQSKGIAWPRFDGHQMSNLIAYLNSGAKGKK